MRETVSAMNCPPLSTSAAASPRRFWRRRTNGPRGRPARARRRSDRRRRSVSPATDRPGSLRRTSTSRPHSVRRPGRGGPPRSMRATGPSSVAVPWTASGTDLDLPFGPNSSTPRPRQCHHRESAFRSARRRRRPPPARRWRRPARRWRRGALRPTRGERHLAAHGGRDAASGGGCVCRELHAQSGPVLELLAGRAVLSAALVGCRLEQLGLKAGHVGVSHVARSPVALCRHCSNLLTMAAWRRAVRNAGKRSFRARVATALRAAEKTPQASHQPLRLLAGVSIRPNDVVRRRFVSVQR